jgi:nitrite reductase (NADH) small subunit
MPGWVKMATLDELAPGQSKEVEHDGRIYALFNISGEISAVDGICPHQGGPLAEGPVSGTCVTCPWHGWQFDVKTGSTPINTRLKLPVFDVRIEGRDVFVSVP